MNIKRLVTWFAIILLSGSVMAAPGQKGTINSIDTGNGWVSINYEDLRLADSVEVSTFEGSDLSVDDLSAEQHVRYSIDRLGQVISIRVYDPRKLRQQGFYSGNDLNH